MEMTEKEFTELEEALEEAYCKLESLQRVYRGQTGKRWVVQLYLYPYVRGAKKWNTQNG